MKKILAGLIIFLCFGTLAWAEAPAHSSESSTVLVIPFDVLTEGDAYAALDHGIPDLLSASITSNTKHIQLVERARLDALIEEKSLSWQGYLMEQSVQEIGTLAQAQFLLRGSVTEQKGKAVLRAFLYETETTRLVRAFEARGSLDQLQALCADIARQLEDVLSRPIDALPELIADENPEQSNLFIQGIGAFYRGRYDHAFAAFMNILEANPGEPLARYWLAKSFHGAGLQGHAVIEFKQFLAAFPNHEKAVEAKAYLSDER